MTIAAMYASALAEANPEIRVMESRLISSGHRVLRLHVGEDLPASAEILLSIGGDGTFLRSCAAAAPAGVPVLGVNAGHLGFLSENTPSAVADALCGGHYSIEERSLLDATVCGKSFIALNEVCVRRHDGQMLGISVKVDDNLLPTYWADGLLISTPSGSTAYSLSLGGPIVMPSSRVFIIAPMAPHNLNVRPLIVPQEAVITLSLRSRCPLVSFSADNTSEDIPSDSTISVRMAQFSLKRVCLDNTSFIKALSEKLFWGEDKRNRNDK